MYVESNPAAESEKIYTVAAIGLYPEQIAINSDCAVVVVPSVVGRILNVLWRRRRRGSLVLRAYCDGKCQSSDKPGTAKDAIHELVLQS